MANEQEQNYVFESTSADLAKPKRAGSGHNSDGVLFNHQNPSLSAKEALN